MDKEKEIRLLIYEQSQIIKHAKKRIKDLNIELAQYEGEKKLNMKSRRRHR